MSPADVCAAAVAGVAVAGAWLTVTVAAQAAHVMQVTDPVSEHLAEIQLTLGEGPSLDVVASGGPVLASDLGTQEMARRWPVFAPAACRAGAGAVFVFPLLIGTIRMGVLGLYRDRRGSLSQSQLGDALTFAETATLLLLDSAHTEASGSATHASLGGQPDVLALHRAEIDQATGMLTEQLGTGMADAFLRLRAYAYAQDRRMADVASDIVARRLRLQTDPDLSEGSKA